MGIRYDDDARSIALSVRDLVEEGAPSGHLTLEVVQTRAARAAAGRRVHTDWQTERAAATSAYRAEVTIKRAIPVGDWTVNIWGRVDGVEVEDGRTIVEEVKSSPLDARRLFATVPSDWPGWLAQLEVYLWMLADAGHPDPVGRLVLVSLVDGSHHVLGVALDAVGVSGWIRERLEQLVVARERRLAWMARRRERVVPLPHVSWRAGQREIAEAVEWGLDAKQAILVEAPTGLGKTDAALVGVLNFALRTNRQVFWATARTTQQDGAIRSLRRLKEAGLPLRSVQIAAKGKVCLNDIVSCRPDACRFADGYYDRLTETGLPGSLADRDDHVDPGLLRSVGSQCRLCPFELGLDLVTECDVVVGDYNYVFEPSVHLARAFDDAPGSWIVVADEVHQLVDRARDWFSPRVEARLARDAVARLWAAGPDYGPFVALAERIEALVTQIAYGPVGRTGGELAVVDPQTPAWQDLAAEIDAVGLDYALLKADRPVAEASDDDPWLSLARQVLRFAAVDPTEDLVSLAGRSEGNERVQHTCLDPSRYLGGRIAALGGFVGLSATLSPHRFYRDLLGLDPEKLDVVVVPSPFPPERRQVMVASRISTAFKDREQHAGPTAKLLADCVAAVPGNVAIYFPSFAMADDIVGRLVIPGRELLVQRSGMDDTLRAEALARLSEPGAPKVLCAVLGGVFAEGIDLPPGALDAVFVVGPALPPIGLERDLLREYYETKFGAGFLYASLVPGMTRVVQAAGRLIRRPEDRGVILLIDRRFRWRDVIELLPGDWGITLPGDPAAAIRGFFAGEAEVGEVGEVEEVEEE